MNWKEMHIVHESFNSFLSLEKKLILKSHKWGRGLNPLISDGVIKALGWEPKLYNELLSCQICSNCNAVLNPIGDESGDVYYYTHKNIIVPPLNCADVMMKVACE